MSAAERRTEERLHYPSTAYIEKEYFGGSDDVKVLNISFNGMSISTSLELTQDEYLSIQIEHPVTLETLRLMGEITWVDKTDENTCQAGIFFHPMDKNLQEKIKAFLAALDQKYEPTQPRKAFAQASNVQEEIERILDLAPQEPVKQEPQVQEPEPSKGPTPHLAMEFSVERRQDTGNRSFFRIFVILLLLVAGGLTYGIYDQIQKQERAFEAQNQAYPTPRATEIIEQDVNEQGEVAKTNEIALTPKPSEMEQVYPYHGGLTFENDPLIQEVSWFGDEASLTFTWMFQDSVSVQDVASQKLTFDPQNIRYLIQLPTQGGKITQSEMTIDHPLVSRIRMGLHGNAKTRLHLVFDVPTSAISLNRVAPDAKSITMVFADTTP